MASSVETDGPEIKKMVKMGRRRPMSFAFAPGKGDGGDFLAIDRKRAPSAVGRMAKAESGLPKVAFGTFEVDGKIMTLTCERAVSGMARKLKKHLKLNKVAVNIVVLDESGNSLESDIEELEGDDLLEDGNDEDDLDDAENGDSDVAEVEIAAADESQDTEPEDPQADRAAAVQLAQRLKAARDAVAPMQSANGEKMMALLKSAAALLKAGNLEKAEAAVTAVEGALAKRADAKANAQGDAKEMIARAGELKAEIAALGRDQAPPLLAKLGQIAQALKAGDLSAAQAQLTELEADIARERQAAQAEPAAPAPEAAPEAPANDDGGDTAAIAARIAELRQTLGAMQGPAVAKMATGLDGAEAALQGGKPAQAEKTLDTIAAAMARMAPAAAAEPAPGAPTSDADAVDAQAEAWFTAYLKLEADVLAALKSGKAGTQDLRTSWNFATSLASEDHFERALASLPDVEAKLKAVQAADDSSTDHDVPADVVPFLKSRLAWRDTRVSLQAEITRLKKAIDAALAGAEGYEEAAGSTDLLFSYLDKLDERLETALERLIEAPEGDGRTALKKEAMGIVGEYRTELDSDFFKAVDTQNGFVNVSVRAAALNTLGDVSAALK